MIWTAFSESPDRRTRGLASACESVLKKKKANEARLGRQSLRGRRYRTTTRIRSLFPLYSLFFLLFSFVGASIMAQRPPSGAVLTKTRLFAIVSLALTLVWSLSASQGACQSIYGCSARSARRCDPNIRKTSSSLISTILLLSKDGGWPLSSHTTNPFSAPNSLHASKKPAKRFLPSKSIGRPPTTRAPPTMPPKSP